MGKSAAAVVLAGYDGTSRVAGASLGALPLWQMLANTCPALARAQTPLVIGEESKNSAFWCRKLKTIALEQPVKLALGGEHLISFPLLEVLGARHPGLRVVVLDAHHDAYDYPLLTHYSLFHYVRHELQLETMIVGARHELEQMPPGCELVEAGATPGSIDAAISRVRAFVAGAPFYFSVDLDVLDPKVFPAVSDAVPGGLRLEQLTALTHAVLELGPVALDVVEYNPLLDRGHERLSSLGPFFREIGQWLE
jgi:agmatinase